MAGPGPIHGFGVLLIFVASILLLITTVTSPVVNRMSLLTVALDNSSNINFGTFGWCVTDAEQGNSGNDYCSPRTIGYNIAVETANAVLSKNGSSFNGSNADAANTLTQVMVLHPVACGITFLASLIGIGAGTVGSICSVLAAALSWAITFIILATDLATFVWIRNTVNSDSTTLATAYWGVGMRVLIAAFIALFLGMLVVLFTACSARRRSRRDARRAATALRPKSEYAYEPVPLRNNDGTISLGDYGNVNGNGNAASIEYGQWSGRRE